MYSQFIWDSRDISIRCCSDSVALDEIKLTNAELLCCFWDDKFRLFGYFLLSTARHSLTSTNSIFPPRGERERHYIIFGRNNLSFVMLENGMDIMHEARELLSVVEPACAHQRNSDEAEIWALSQRHRRLTILFIFRITREMHSRIVGLPFTLH